MIQVDRFLDATLLHLLQCVFCTTVGILRKSSGKGVLLNMRRESLTELSSVNAVWCRSGTKISPTRANSFECQSANGEAPRYSCVRIHTACSAGKPPVRLPSGGKRERSSEHAKLGMQTTACQKLVNPVTPRLRRSTDGSEAGAAWQGVPTRSRPHGCQPCPKRKRAR